MKTLLKVTAFYSLALILGGCVASLHPFFTEKDIVFEPNLIGNWASAEPNESLQFKKAKDNYYDCLYVDKNGKPGKFTAGLGKLANNMYLDVYAVEPNLTQNDFYKSHILTAHSIVKIILSDGSLKVCSMSPDSIESLLKSKPTAVKHETLENDSGRIVLTAPTKELQKFILKYGSDKKADLFRAKDFVEFHRVSK